MFDKNFNIVIGDRASHRTTFLIELSRAIRTHGKKVMFLGGTDEFKDFGNNSISKIFDLAFFYQDDTRLFENIKEIAERDEYEYIFIDDIENFPNRHIKTLADCSVKKIATCLTDIIPILNSESNIYEIKTSYDDSHLMSTTYLEIGQQKVDIKDIIKTIERDQKLNSLLK